jgi:DNA-binding transcriptional ArsR family regulator
MTEDADHDVAVTTPGQFKALGHPMRHRLLFALGRGEATISQLAATLGSNQGNISHHLKVLTSAGLVQAAGTRTVRGGTEQYYRRAFIRLSYDDHGATEAAFRAIAAEIADAEPGPFLMLRALRLSPEHAEQITATLHDLAEQADDGGDHPRYGLLLGLYQPSLAQPAGQPPPPDDSSVPAGPPGNGLPI